MISLSGLLILGGVSGDGEGRGSPVNKTGKIKISHMLVPLAAWIEAMPKSATSEEVSKPRPKRMPRGYIFHGLPMFVSAENTPILNEREQQSQSPVNKPKHPLKQME